MNPDAISSAINLVKNNQTPISPESEQSYQQNLMQSVMASLKQMGSGKNIDSRQPGDVTGQHDYAGLCQKYAEQMTYGKTGIYPSASAAFNDYSGKGQSFSDMSQAKPGDLVYFKPDKSNNNLGHVGIYQGNGSFKSATYSGIRNDSLTDWSKSTGQQIAGFVHP